MIKILIVFKKFVVDFLFCNVVMILRGEVKMIFASKKSTYKRTFVFVSFKLSWKWLLVLFLNSVL